MVKDDGRHPGPTNAAAWLTLYHTPGIGRRKGLRLLSECGGITALLQRAASGDPALGLKPEATAWCRAPDRAVLETALSWLELPGHQLVTWGSPDYPELLAQTPDPPLLLFVKGDASLLTTPQIAMVGSRNPSASGRQTAHDFASFLAEAGITITSGLAIGIDGASHEGALDVEGLTIAVAGTSLDRVYPARHRQLAHRIAATGALVSEFPPGVPLRRNHFAQRNRLISGLSLGTLVVEAAIQSGSLITARHALEQGREVFAIPGSIHNPLARGCHQLLRQGAKLVETGQDVLEELAPQLRRSLQRETAPTTEDEAAGPLRWDSDYQQLLATLGFDPVPMDLLINRSGLTPEAVSSMLLLLELEGYVTSSPGGQYALSGNSDLAAVQKQR